VIRADLLLPVATAIVAALAILVAIRPDLTRAKGGKILAFFALFLLPAAAMFGGFSSQLAHAQSTEFCLSCHVMTDYGRSLQMDDPSYLPAVHFQNNRVPRERACYTCHTDYAMFGGVRSKLRGLRHLYVQYFGTIPEPGKIQLYQPYNNRECLYCHGGARNFEEQSAHIKKPELLRQMKENELSCATSRCHEFVHDVESLADVPLWKGALP
jgi:cytochrome c-type protein NapC